MGSMLKVVVLYNLLERLQKGEEKDILAEDGILEEIRRGRRGDPHARGINVLWSPSGMKSLR